MPRFPTPSDHLLERYCAGDCTPAERAEVEVWAAADPSNAETLSALAAAWHGAGAATVPADQPDVDAAWVAVRNRILDEPAVVPAAVREPRRLGVWRRFILPGAAAAALTLTVGGGMWMAYVARNGAAMMRAADGPMRQVATHRGQRAALDLPDGSRVVLAADSRLRVPYAYGPSRGARDVFLEGEAYFEVRPDPKRAFRVHAAAGVAEALGTAFVVTAYPETRGVEVVTTSGAVTLRLSPEIDPSVPVLLTLTPGALGHVDAAGNATLTRDIAWAPRVAWVTGTLVFERTPMRDAVLRLERWYDLDIRLADSTLADRELTVAFSGGTADQVLALVASTLGADIEQEGNTMVLHEKRP